MMKAFKLFVIPLKGKAIMGKNKRAKSWYINKRAVMAIKTRIIITVNRFLLIIKSPAIHDISIISHPG